MSNCYSVQYPLIENKNSENKFKYEEIPVESELSDFIYCFWNFYSYNYDTSMNITLIPDPCVNIIIDLNNPSNIYILGPIDRPIKHEIPSSSQFWGMRFLPGRFSMFSSVPMNSILNKLLPFDDRFYEVNKLDSNILEKHDINGLQNYAEEQILSTRKCTLTKASELDVLASIECIYKNKGNVYIHDLARLNYCSIRTLSRKYYAAVGINPKLMCRIIRFQYTLFNYFNISNSSIMDIALNNGYYDQSHFAKDFKEFIGVTPSMCNTQILQNYIL